MTPEAFAKILSIPSGYAAVRLGMNTAPLKLHPIHKQVLDTLFSKHGSKVSLVAGNETGKTLTVVAAAVLYALDVRSAIVVATSGVYRQIVTQLMPAITKYKHLYPHWTFNENHIIINGEKRFISFASDSEGAGQGFHESPEHPLLVIVDESSEVDDSLFNALERCRATWTLLVGSPLYLSGRFYDINTKDEFKKFYNRFRLPATECVVSKGYWIKDERLNEMIEQYGETSPLVLSSVYAEFASNLEGGLISLAELNTCYDNFPPFMGKDMHVGIDVAAGGGDKNVISFRRGNKVEIIDIWSEDEVMRACDRIKMRLDELKEKYGIAANQVSIDVGGMGIGFHSRLKDLGWNINQFNGGAASESLQYANKIAEIWFNGIQKIKKCTIILPDNNEFRLQLLSRKQMFNDKGKLKLESKKDLKSRGVHSPDIADALFLSMSNPLYGAVHFHKQPVLPPRKYSGWF